jgi:hypothetical protein
VKDLYVKDLYVKDLRACRCAAEGLVAIPAGFEPATHGVEIRYSIQLSYGTIQRSDRGAFIALPI